jgi:hypothetical protein
MSGQAQAATAEVAPATSRARGAAVAFIFVTILLDGMVR